MKIPSHANDKRRNKIVHAFDDAADKYSPEYGVFILVRGEYLNDEKDISKMTRIYFMVMEHEFESIRDLRKALRLKAFA